MKHNPVEHPLHYCGHPSQVECIDITENMGFAVGNAFKYLYRCDRKGNTLQDIEKAIWYIKRELERRKRRSWWLRWFSEPPVFHNAREDGTSAIRHVVRCESRYSGHMSAALGYLWAAQQYPRSLGPLQSALRSVQACERIARWHQDRLDELDTAAKRHP